MDPVLFWKRLIGGREDTKEHNGGEICGSQE